MHAYTDQDIEYQVTTYSPAETDQAPHKPWPAHVQKAISAFKTKHEHLHLRTEKYHHTREKLPKAYRDVVQALRAGESQAIEVGEQLSVISLTKKTDTHTPADHLKDMLYDNCKNSYHQVLLQQKLKLLADYAYTHPESLAEFAKTHGLQIITHATDAFAHQPLLSDPDFIEAHYISDPIKIHDLHYQLVQLTSVTPPRAKTYEEALPEVKDIYFRHVVLPQLVEKLSHARSVSDLEPLCQKYQLTLQFRDSEHHPSLEVQDLIPTRLSPKTTYDNIRSPVATATIYRL